MEMVGIEPTTLYVQSTHSTIELHPHVPAPVPNTLGFYNFIERIELRKLLVKRIKQLLQLGRNLK